MNEPLITLRETEDHTMVRQFADGEAATGRWSGKRPRSRALAALTNEQWWKPLARLGRQARARGSRIGLAMAGWQRRG